MIDALMGKIAHNQMWWSDVAGFGFFNCDGYNQEVGSYPYDDDYFNRYRDMAATSMAARLNGFRRELVSRYLPAYEKPFKLLDVGIGDGAFLREIAGLAGVRSYGTDINPASVAWLVERAQLAGYGKKKEWDAVTFWDSLEHFRDPRLPLQAAKHLAFVSIPIFQTSHHALASKHFRPEEHYWYFTREGFTRFVNQEGFEVVEVLTTETDLGREDIETFVLRRSL